VKEGRRRERKSSSYLPRIKYGAGSLLKGDADTRKGRGRGASPLLKTLPLPSGKGTKGMGNGLKGAMQIKKNIWIPAYAGMTDLFYRSYYGKH
jgi:hypothetical protein